MVKTYFKTMGCPTNASESEAMMAMLEKADFEIVDSPEEAFLIVISICTVKGNTTALREIRKVVEAYPNKKLIVAGCITDDIIPLIKEIKKDLSLISTHNILEIVSVAEETINDNPIDVITPPEQPAVKANLPRIRTNPVVAIVPICSGCTGSCTYCSVRIVKGKLFSYPMDSILKECQKSITHGAREIWITAQDTASYMLDKESKPMLPELVSKITKIPGIFKIRVGMMNVNNLIPVMDEMINVFKSEKVFKFLHIPVQSGSDEVLKRMGRKYTVQQFRDAVARFRKEIPEITISTDIICGFPGETAEDFSKSVKLIEELQPDILNVSKFRQRLGTESAAMANQVSGDEAKQRAARVTSAFDWNALNKNKRWLGWKGEIIIDEKGKEGTGTCIGRNFAYKPVVVEGELTIGDVVDVKVTNFTKYDLRAELVR